jgi:hypothetical protein
MGLSSPRQRTRAIGSQRASSTQIGGRKATYLDVQGTYLYKYPANFAAPAEKRPDYRLLAVQFDGKDNTYTFKLVGPAKTVEAAKKDFEEWLKSFK